MTPSDLGLVYGLLFTYREVHGNPPDRHLREGEAEAARIADDRKGPLFRSLDRERHLTERLPHRLEVLATRAPTCGVCRCGVTVLRGCIPPRGMQVSG